MMTKPSFRQWLWYNLGGRLPDDMQEWVLHDLTGPGADARYLMRWTIPAVPLLLLFLLVPGPIWISIVMMIYILIPLVYFAVALDYVYRRFRMQEHGLDPMLVNRTRRGARKEREEYKRDYGHE